MKILYVTTISNTVDAFLIPHISLLRDLGHQVDIACNIVSTPDRRLSEMGCKIHSIPFQRVVSHRGNYTALHAIKALVLSEGYELVHVHTPVASFLTRFACRDISKLKVLYTAHGFHFYKGAPFKNWMLYYPLERLASRWTDGVITMNSEDYALAKKMRVRKKDSVFYIHGVGIDLNRFSTPKPENKKELREKYGFHTEDFILFYAAELSSRKNQDLLIDVIDGLVDQVKNVRLLLAGDGYLAEHYQQEVQKRGLTGHIIFLGFREDIPDLLKLSDVAVSSSRQEGLPVNVMEAMATGLPVVVTDCRGNRDLVCNGQTGYIVGMQDARGFAKAIGKLYHSEALRQRLGLSGMQRIKDYSITQVLSEIEGIYQNYLE